MALLEGFNIGGEDVKAPSAPASSNNSSLLKGFSVNNTPTSVASAVSSNSKISVADAIKTLPDKIAKPANVNTESFGQKYSNAFDKIGATLGGVESTLGGGIAKGFGDLTDLIGGNIMRGLAKVSSTLFGDKTGDGQFNEFQQATTKAATVGRDIATDLGVSKGVQDFSQGTGEFIGKKLPLIEVGTAVAAASGIPALLGGMLESVPVVGRFLAPTVTNTISNLAGFSLADQPFAKSENPTAADPHWKQFVSDIGNSVLFGLTGSIPKPLLAVPATGIAAYGAAKLSGASNAEALASALVIAGMHAYGVIGDEKVLSHEDAINKTRQEAIDKINKYSKDKITLESTPEEIDRAFKQAAKSGYSGLHGADEKVIKGLNWSREFLKSQIKEPTILPKTEEAAPITPTKESLEATLKEFKEGKEAITKSNPVIKAQVEDITSGFRKAETKEEVSSASPSESKLGIEAKKYATVEEFRQNITASKLRQFLNESGDGSKIKTASNTATGSRIRKDGDYLYNQDRGSFDAMLSDINEGRNLNSGISEDITKFYNQVHGIDTNVNNVDNGFHGKRTNTGGENGALRQNSGGAGNVSGDGSGRVARSFSGDLMEASGRLSKNYSRDGKVAELLARQARELGEGKPVVIDDHTGNLLREVGFSDALVDRIETGQEQGAFKNVVITETHEGQSGDQFVSAYKADTLYLNPKQMNHPTYKDGTIIKHEGSHSWYRKLAPENKLAFYNELKNNRDAIRQAWNGSDNPYKNYWKGTLDQIAEKIEFKTSKAKADQIIADFSLEYDPNITLDTFIDRSLNIDKNIIAINAELARIGVDPINLEAQNTVAVEEHVAMLGERSNVVTPETEPVKNFISDINNDTLKYGPQSNNALIYQGETDLTLKTLEKLKGRTTVSKQFISDLTNSPDLKQTERDIIRTALDQYPAGAQIPVKDFADVVKAELLPLKIKENYDARYPKSSDDNGYPIFSKTKFESISLPSEIRGNVENYNEHVFESPIKTSAGLIHFPNESIDNYFGHTRIEDMADDSTRRVIEVQSDLYQKGRIDTEDNPEGEIGNMGVTYEGNNIWGIRNSDGDIEDTFSSEKEADKALEKLKDKNRKADVDKLRQYSNPTAHFRMVREELRATAQDGKNKVLFPTGETAMKIEGLGENNTWGIRTNRSTREPYEKLTPDLLKVGETINNGGDWIITDVLGDGKFKAVPKNTYEAMLKLHKGGGDRFSDEARGLPFTINDVHKENFDISGKVDTNNPIYRFYEKDLGRYLKNNYDAKPVTDAQGVTWYEVPVNPEMATAPVTAFREKNPEFNSGDKLQDVRDALAHVEKRVGTKATDINQLNNMLNREETSLAAHNVNPEAHIKAYGENRKPKYEAKIKELKSRIKESEKNILDSVKTVRVSGKDIELPYDLQQREINLELKRQLLDENPLKGLLKYVATSGEFEGQLPEMTGQTAAELKGTKAYGRTQNKNVIKFIENGDRIINEVLGEGDTYAKTRDPETVRKQMDAYIREYQSLLNEEIKLKADKKAFTLEAKNEQALDKLSSQNAKRIEAEIESLKKEQKLKEKALAEARATERAEIEKKEKKYGFKVPEYDDKSPLVDKVDLIAVEDAIRTHTARPFMKYVNNRTGILPEITPETPGVYGEEMSALLKRKGFTSVADAQKAVDNYLAHIKILDQMSEDKYNPLELMQSEAVIDTPVFQTEKERLSVPGAKALTTMTEQSDAYPLNKKVGIIDYVRTPDRVFNKIGLGDEIKLVKQKYNDYLKELPKNIDKITDWSKRTPRPGASQRIFDYLDGMPGEDGFLKPDVLFGEELKVAEEIKMWLQDWAVRLGLKPHEMLSNYITHIFEDDLIKKEFDEDLAKIIQDKVPGEVYNPFLQQRLGKLGYVHDAWRALDAYVKRATRKVHMDVALEKVKVASAHLDIASFNYVKKYIDRVNLRPTNTDTLIDNSIKQLVGYRLGSRPVAKLSRIGRQWVYRGTMGLNFGFALRNLTQGVNTYATLGEKYTAIGYIKLFNKLNHQELYEENILSSDIIQDRVLSSTKKFWEKFDKGLFIMNEAVEHINRGAAYFGAKAKYYAENSRVENGIQIWKEGSSEKRARLYARNIVEKTQFTFGSVDTPVALQSDIMKTLFQFQSYNFKEAEFIHEIFTGKDEEGKRNFAGMIRFISASLFVIYSLGRLFGMKLKDAIPFSNYRLPPLIALPLAIGQAIIGSDDKYGNKPTPKARLNTAIGGIVPFIPAGAQAKKIIDSAIALKQGYSANVAGNPQYQIAPGTLHAARALIFGKNNLPEAQEYFDSLGKPNPMVKIYDEVQNLVNEGKKDEATALINSLTADEKKQYKTVLASKKQDAANKAAVAMLPTVKKVQKLVNEGKKDEALKVIGALTDKQKTAYKAALKIFPSNKTDAPDIPPNTPVGKLDFIDAVSTYAKATKTDPVDAFKVLFSKEHIRGVLNPSFLSSDSAIVVFRDDKKESSERATQGKTAGYSSDEMSNLQLDHFIPLEAGGRNSTQNLDLVTTEQNQTLHRLVEAPIAKALSDGKISRKKALEYITRYKIGTLGEKPNQYYMDLYQKKYNSQPLTANEIVKLINSGEAD